MLFDIILIYLAIYLTLLPFFIRVKTEPSTGNKEVSFDVPVPIKKKQKPVVSPSEQRILDILQNIDAYDGTSTGQKPIKER